MKSNWILLVLLFISQWTFSQDRVTLYLNSKGEITKQDSADCKCNSEFDLQNFRLNGILNCSYQDGKTKFVVTYLKGVKNGLCEIYHRNGKKLSTGKYLNNARNGVWYFYYPNGQLMQTVKFTDNIYSREMNSNIMVGEFYSEDGKQLIKNGNGKWYNDTVYFSLLDKVSPKTIKGEFKDSLKHGSWILKDLRNKSPMQTETFNLGKFVTGRVYYSNNSQGTAMSESIYKLPDRLKDFFSNVESFNLDSTSFPDSVRYLGVEKIFETITGREFHIKNRDAGYIHGDLALMEYISKNIRYPAEARRLGYQGTITIQLTIDKNGKAKDIKVLKGLHPSLDNEALRIVKSINEWICALHEGEPYEKAIGVPIKFVMN